jgi:murein DD-endopeptidase MepM/ murein hydrolase activator NlpD
MTILTQTTNAKRVGKFLNLVRPRDIFFHDGSTLRRVRIGTGVQAGASFALLLLFLWAAAATVQLALAVSAPLNPQISRIQHDVEAMQADVAAMKAVAAKRYELTAAEMKKLGLEPARFHAGRAYTGSGGPLELVEPARAEDPNFKALFMSWKKLDQIELGTIAIPSTVPVHGTNFTSGFGVRSDPFKGRAAMHAGIDLAGPLNTPIYATADGTVDRAEWNTGGYGNLVEIDHGRGIQTRYGHLTRYIVAAGEHVKRGQLIAYMGSTGRSTGSHLHYEVRIDGKPVNPVPFLQSSDYLQSVQRRAATQVALGGPAKSE